MSHYGNLQKIKNGKRTYGITPHIPGGFILPETLIKIGEVAKKYNGVLKITSGQRILITNLKEEDLKNIWEDLGMEPAVKNQYSVKNVEICPANFCKRSKYPTIGIGMKISKNFHGILVDIDGKFFVTAGGSAGFYPRMSDIITKGLSEKEAYELVKSILEYYNEHGQMGEKLGDFIDRIGINTFRKDVLEKSNLKENL